MVLFCEPYDQGQVRNMSAQPDQIIRFTDCLTVGQCRGISAEKVVRKDTVCHVHTINIKIRLHSLLNKNSYFTVFVHVCMRTQIRRFRYAG